MRVKMIKVHNVCLLFNSLRPGLLAGIKSRGGGQKTTPLKTLF